MWFLSSRYLSVIAPSFTAIGLALTFLVPIVSISSDPNELSSLYYARINATDASITLPGSPPRTLNGLPDKWDSDKYKQVYWIYLLNYCSGYQGIGSSAVIVDYCSPNGHGIHENLDIWTKWGESVDGDDGPATFEWVNYAPRLMWVAYLVAAVLMAISLASALIRLHRRRVGIVFIMTVSTLATISSLATAIATQATYGMFVSQADKDHVSITASSGRVVYVLNWLAMVCLAIATTLWVLWRRRSEKERNYENNRTDRYLRPFVLGKLHKHRTVAEKSGYTYESVRDVQEALAFEQRTSIPYDADDEDGDLGSKSSEGSVKSRTDSADLADLMDHKDEAYRYELP